MRKFLFVLFSFILFSSIPKVSLATAKVVDCGIEADNYPAVQSFLALNSNTSSATAVACTDSDGNDYKVAFTGLGVGLEVSALEGLKMAYIGLSDDVVGTYYGVRAAASFIVGPNMLLAWGNWGQLTVVGGDLFAIGADVSLVKIYIGKTWEEVRSAIVGDQQE